MQRIPIWLALSCMAVSLPGCAEAPRTEEPSVFGSNSDASTEGPDDGTGTTTTSTTTTTTSTSTSTSTSTPTTTSSSSNDPSMETTASTSTGDAESSGGSESSSGSFETSNDGQLQVQIVQQSAWATGECNDVIVTNVSGSSVTWVIELDVGGVINQSWNVVLEDVVDGLATFSGVAFNADLAPDAAAMFGYCVDF